MITASILSAMGCRTQEIEKYLEPLQEAGKRAELNTPLREAHFLAQVLHECMSLRQMEEFASGEAYEGRLDLGNTNPGDGVKYRGHGGIQCTGKKNHELYGIWMGMGDLFVREPGMIVTNPRFAIMTAPWFWITHKLNAVVDLDKGAREEMTILIKGKPKLITVNSVLRRVTRIINGGANGIEDRQRRFAIASRAGIIS